MVTFNTAFERVVTRCADPRAGQRGTWITTDMMSAYGALHDTGWAHSVEVWQNDTLVGGLYGLSIGRAFFGESMYSAVPNASKAAMFVLCRVLHEQAFLLLDCQVVSPHLFTLGAMQLPRPEFRALLDDACRSADKFANWPERQILLADML